MACINRSSSEFQELIRLTGFHPDIIAAKVAVYQNKFGENSFPLPSEIMARTATAEMVLNNSGLEGNIKGNSLPDSYCYDSYYDMMSGSPIMDDSIDFGFEEEIELDFEMVEQGFTEEGVLGGISNVRGPGNLIKIRKDDIKQQRELIQALQREILKIQDPKQVQENLKRYTGINSKTDARNAIRQARETIKQIEAQIDELRKIKTGVKTAQIQEFVDKELEYVAELIATKENTNLERAKRILSTLTVFNDFINDERHLLFTKEEIAQLSEADKKLIYNAAGRINELGNTIAMIYRDNVREMIKNSVIMEQAQEKLKDTKLLESMNESMRDNSAWTKYFMGVGFSGEQEHWTPAVIDELYSGVLDLKDAEFNKYFEKISTNQELVEKRLLKMGHNLEALGITGVKKGVAWKVFWQQDEQGNPVQQLIGKFSHKWDRAYWQNISTYKSDTERIRKKFKSLPGMAVSESVKAIEKRNKFFNDNSHHVNPFELEEVRNSEVYKNFHDMEDNMGNKIFQADIDDVQNSQPSGVDLKVLLGAREYKKLVDNTLNQLQDYMEEYESVREIDNNHETWRRKNSPFHNFNDIVDTGMMPEATSTIYRTFVPKRNSDTGQQTGFYDSVYEKIVETDDSTFEFLEGVRDMFDAIYEGLGYEGQRKIFGRYYIPEMDKTMMDRLADAQGFMGKINAVKSSFWQWFKGLFMGVEADELSLAKRDHLSGEKLYDVNMSFLSKNRKRLDNIEKMERMKVLALYNATIGKNGPKLKNITRSTVMLAKHISPVMLSAINELTGTPQWTKDNYTNKYGENIPIGQIIIDYAQHQVVAETSFDLPKIMKLYGKLAAEASARNVVLPQVLALQDNHNAIKQPVKGTNKQSRAGEDRTRAIDKIDWQIHKHILGYNTNEQLFSGTLKSIEPEEVDVTDEQGNIVGTRWEYQRKEKKVMPGALKFIEKGVDEYLEKYGNLLADDDISTLKASKEQLKQVYLADAIKNVILNYRRIKGLGFNFSSAITNVVAGQMSNFITAAGEEFFPYEKIFNVSPQGILRVSTMSKNKGLRHLLTNDKTNMAVIAFMQYGVIQDSKNEFQRASEASRHDGVDRYGNPFYMLTKGEELNQIPLFAAVMDSGRFMVTDKNGNQATLWNALELEERKDADGKIQGWKVVLKNEFKGVEGNEQWENMTGPQFSNFKNFMEKVTIRGHGDFAKKSGMMIKEGFLGKLLMMFKTFYPMELNKRYGAERYVFATGNWEKGRYRSHTPITGFLSAGTATFLLPTIAGFGLVGSGIAGTIVGGGLLLFGGSRALMSIGNFTLKHKSRLHLTKNLVLDGLLETTMIMQHLAQKMFGTLMNPVARMFHIKSLVRNYGSHVLWKGDDGRLAVHRIEDILGKTELSEIDIQNWKANMQEIAANLLYIGAAITIKSLLMDEDDDKDGKKRRAHNLLMNLLAQYSQDITQFMDPTQIAKTGLVPDALRFFEEFGRFTKALGEDQHIVLQGDYAGQDARAVAFKNLFMPGLARGIWDEVVGNKNATSYYDDDGNLLTDLYENIDFWRFLGFETRMKRQFTEMSIDDWFTPVKNDMKQRRERILLLKQEKIKDPEFQLQSEGKTILNQQKFDIWRRQQAAQYWGQSYDLDKSKIGGDGDLFTQSELERYFNPENKGVQRTVHYIPIPVSDEKAPPKPKAKVTQPKAPSVPKAPKPGQKPKAVKEPPKSDQERQISRDDRSKAKSQFMQDALK
jgi:hypothetical protein